MHFNLPEYYYLNCTCGDSHTNSSGSVSLAPTPNANVDAMAAGLASAALASKPWQAVAAILHRGLHSDLAAIAPRLHQRGYRFGVRH